MIKDLCLDERGSEFRHYTQEAIIYKTTYEHPHYDNTERRDKMSQKKHGLFRKTLSALLSAACIFSSAAVTGAAMSTTVSAAEKKDAPAFSWDNASVYFLLTDRFYNGNTSNDHSYNRGCDATGNVVSGWSQEAAFQGGDFAGITKKIDEGYFEDLGVNAIWLSAPYEQIHGYVVGGNGSPSFAHFSYHGYYVLDYTETDANFGTKAEFETMVDTAHEHGIRIVLDIVMNHAGYNDLKTMDEFGFGSASGWQSYYYSYKNTNNTDYHSFIDYDSQSAWAKWWGSDWIRCGLPGYTKGDGEVAGSLEGLPDFKTESGTTVGIPEVLKTKWTKEGTYSAKVAKYGESGTVRSYLVKWLTEWVKEYGVDGFRCDTAKHVEMASWKALKEAGVAALKEWRQNHPDKPGAKWTDDFWMTGECFGHRADKSNYFTEGGFDSMINFDFAPAAGSSNIPAAGTVEGVYSSYAGKINIDDNFNVLSYIASHDTTLAKGDRKYAGSFLLMLPGGIQIYYGDETNRPMASVNGDSTPGAGHMFRSFMNWDSIDKDILAHWQKVGTFRNNHLSVGAGSHKVISAYDATNGYTFSRSYEKNGIEDKIVATLFASANKDITIDVSSVWSDGIELTNWYDGTTAKVSGGKVTFNSGANGTILLQEPDGAKGKVIVTHIDQDTGATIKTETMQGLIGDPFTTSPLSTEGYKLAKTVGTTSGKYSETEQKVTYYYTFDSDNYAYIVTKFVNAASGEELAESETQVGKIGTTYKTTPKSIKNYEVDETQTTNATGTVVKGTTTVTYKYNYVEPTNLQVHYYNSNSWSAVALYAYNEENGTATEYTGKWPGKAMTAEKDGWFVADVDVESALVILNNNNNGQQEPAGVGTKGYTASGEVWITGGTVYPSGKVTVKYVTTTGKVLASEILKGMADGTNTYTTSAKTFDGYTLTETPNNASGKYTEAAITVTYTYKSDNPDVIEVTSVSLNETSASVAVGSTVTLKATVAPSNATDKTITWKSSNTAVATVTSSGVVKGVKAGTATITAKSSNGKTAKATITVTSVTTLKNTSTISSTSIALGSVVTITGKATGGTTPYQYAAYYKKASTSTWTKVRDYSTTATIKVTPKAATSYNIRVKVKDASNKVVNKDFTVKVTKDTVLTNTSTISATSIALGSTVTITGKATGGTTPYQYAAYYKKASTSTWTKVRDYGTTATIKVTPKAATSYNIRVKVKDASNKVVNKDFTVKVTKSTALTNNSTISATEITLGKSLKVTATAAGGAGSYKYGVYYKKSTSDKWTTAQNYANVASVTFTPKVATKYDVCVKVKDSKDTIVKKYFTVTVSKAAALTNTSKVSATSVAKGTAVKITGSASNYTDMVYYKYEYKYSSATSYTTIKDYTTSTTASFTPAKAGKYTVRVTAMDMAPTSAVKTITVTVT